MTQKEEVQYMRIGLGLIGIVVNDRSAEAIIMTHNKMKEKGGKFSISDAVDIECFIDRKYAKTKMVSVKANNKKKKQKK